MNERVRRVNGGPGEMRRTTAARLAPRCPSASVSRAPRGALLPMPSGMTAPSLSKESR